MKVRILSIVSVLAICSYFLISSSANVQAQAASPAPPGIITSDYTPATLTLLKNLPVSDDGVLVADLHIHNTANVSFDTLANLGQYCRNAFLYRVTDKGDLIAHPFSCDGNNLLFSGTGGDSDNTGDYQIAIFPSAKEAAAAPQSVVQNPETEALSE